MSDAGEPRLLGELRMAEATGVNVTVTSREARVVMGWYKAIRDILVYAERQDEEGKRLGGRLRNYQFTNELIAQVRAAAREPL